MEKGNEREMTKEEYFQALGELIALYGDSFTMYRSDADIDKFMRRVRLHGMEGLNTQTFANWAPEMLSAARAALETGMKVLLSPAGKDGMMLSTYKDP